MSSTRTSANGNVGVGISAAVASRLHLEHIGLLNLALVRRGVDNLNIEFDDAIKPYHVYHVCEKAEMGIRNSEWERSNPKWKQTSLIPRLTRKHLGTAQGFRDRRQPSSCTLTPCTETT